jgi:Xaa-Pro aminopeptidase
MLIAYAVSTYPVSNPPNHFSLASFYCPHFLGMDVHDTATVSRGTSLRPGMVITIEPGVYISQDNTTVPPEFRGIGVRIEDDVLITESGPEVLSAGVPKEVDEIERLVQQGNWKIRNSDSRRT